MIMLDTVDFPIVFLGAIRAGVIPIPLNTLLTSDQYAYVLADCRAKVLFISEALLPVVKDVIGRMPALEHVVVSGADAHGHTKLSDEIAKESDTFTTAATHADEPAFWLYSSGSTGMPKGVRHLHSNLAATAETYAQAGARHSRGRCRTVGGETVLRLRARQRADVSDVGRRHHGAECRTADAAADVRTDEQIQSQHLLRRADAVRGDAERRDAEIRTRRHKAARLHVGRRGAAGVGRQCLEIAFRRRYSRWRRFDRIAAYLSVECAGRHQVRLIGASGARLSRAARQ